MPYKNTRKRKNFHRKWRAERRARMRENGLCIECGEPALVVETVNRATGRKIRKARLRCRKHLDAQKRTT